MDTLERGLDKKKKTREKNFLVKNGGKKYGQKNILPPRKRNNGFKEECSQLGRNKAHEVN